MVPTEVMRVTAALAWWNEQPEDLDACVRAMANIADRVVALDGAYARYPGATAQSHDDQVWAIRDAADDVGLQSLIHQRSLLWPGQVAKRAALLSLAARNADWVVVVDADHIIHADRDIARARLAALDAEGALAIEVAVHTPTNPDRSVEASSPGQWHRAHAGSTVSYPLLYRALPGLTVEQRHWWVAAEGLWLWGGDGTRPLAAHHTMAAEDYLVEHRTLFRTKEQIRASRAFLNDRQDVVMPLTGQEDDRPQLPRPVFDYVRRPAF